ncbi:glycosyltransferase family 2 protein [Thermoflexibacter ruber]|uniref:Glycosyl transferase family 2 n=1 Tax=Thermoflexibacter ruber TaxID=1003 RepID=A0A1I2JCW9_9BACT|nr:glycosyltransferase family 2 protein [Thermoflexibacter ruber]SFF51830.1 Glycosyl transferase family 2 [Thermoflexibacter ruber]
MKNAKVTIITPSYNQAQYLEATIQSILGQNYPHLEYMIFDGGSQDNSLKIIEKYQKHLTYWESEKDKGQSHAINKGLSKATGEIITWINSDDQLMPNALHKIVSYFEANPSVGFLHGKTLLFGQGKEVIKGAESKDLHYKYLAGLPFPQPSAFFRKSVIDELGLLEEDYHYGMDYDFFLRMILNHEALQVQDVLSKYLLHKSSKSVSQQNFFAQDYAKIFSKLLRSFPFTSELIKQMKSLEMYDERDDSYQVKKYFSIDDLTTAFFYHLRFQLIFYFEAGELDWAYRITSFLRKNYPTLYQQDKELAQVNWRAKWLSKNILSFLRWIKRGR